jgi:hypothetical protein
MSEQAPNPNTPEPGQQQSPEELVAALNATEADAMASLQAELATLKAKSADMADQYLRAKADAENARRRAEDEISKARKFAVEGFAESLLPVADSLEAGLIIKDATRPRCASCWPHWSATRCLPSTRRPARSLTRTSTRPSAWCLPNWKPTPWSACCKRAIPLWSACCARPW